MKGRELEGFGERLAALRKARGLTQEELGRIVGLSQRMMAYYESQGGQPPGAILPDLARALHVSADELLGMAPLTQKLPPSTARLRQRLRRVEELPASDQKTVLRLIDALLESRGRKAS